MNSDELSQEDLVTELEELDLALVELREPLHQKDETVRQALNFLEEDSGDLDRLKCMLEERVGEVDIFAELGLHGKELFHSDLLAWLMRPEGSHGLGDRFLQGFVRLLNGRPVIRAADRPTTKVRREEPLDYDGQSGRLDMLIYNARANYVCAIENKVWSPEGDNQLAWYRKVLERDYPGHRIDRVFLTPVGRDPEEDEESRHWSKVSYSHILRLIEEILDGEVIIENSDVRAFLNQYAVTLRRNIVPDVSNDIHELARRIYLKHRPAIDLIIDNRERYTPNYVTDGFRIIREAVGQQTLWTEGMCNRPYVRFRSADWGEYEELCLSDWPRFLLLFEVQVTNNWAKLFLTLFHGDDECLRRRMYDRVKEHGDLFNCEVTAYTEQAIVLHTVGDILEEADFEEWWDEKTVRDRISSRLDKFARGSFPEINEIIRNVMEDHRSAGD